MALRKACLNYIQYVLDYCSDSPGINKYPCRIFVESALFSRTQNTKRITCLTDGFWHTEDTFFWHSETKIRMAAVHKSPYPATLLLPEPATSKINIIPNPLY